MNIWLKWRMANSKSVIGRIFHPAWSYFMDSLLRLRVLYQESKQERTCIEDNNNLFIHPTWSYFTDSLLRPRIYQNGSRHVYGISNILFIINTNNDNNFMCQGLQNHLKRWGSDLRRQRHSITVLLPTVRFLEPFPGTLALTAMKTVRWNMPPLDAILPFLVCVGTRELKQLDVTAGAAHSLRCQKAAGEGKRLGNTPRSLRRRLPPPHRSPSPCCRGRRAGLGWAGQDGAGLRSPRRAGGRPQAASFPSRRRAGEGGKGGRFQCAGALGRGGGVLAPSFERGGRAASAGEAGPPRVWGDAEAAVLPEGGKCPVCGSALRWELPLCLGEGGRGASLLPLEDSTPLCVVVVGGRLPLPPFSSQPARGFAVTGLPGLGLGARPRPLRPLGVTRWRPHRQRSVRGRLPGRSCLPSVDRSLRLLKRTSEAI